MERFTAQYQALMSDFLGTHRAIAAQDAFTASFLQYMINLETRLNSISNPHESPTFPPSHEAQQLMATYSELSRARYDKYTETTRRAEAYGMYAGQDGNVQMQPGGYRRPTSADTDESSPEFSKGVLPSFGNLPSLGMPSMPNGMLQQQQHQAGGLPLPHQQHYQPNSSGLQIPVSQQPQQIQSPSYQQTFQQSYHPLPARHSNSVSDSPAGSSEATHDSGGGGGSSRAVGAVASSNGFANFGEIRLAGQAAIQMPSQQLQPPPTPSNPAFNGPDSYFPALGSMPIRPSAAITPGAVMISTLNTNFASRGNNGGMQHQAHFEPHMPEELADGEEVLTPGTAANTAKNKDPSFLAEGEDIANFAAALKGGQSSAAVRSALTAQPLLIRRATYIPGWSVPPRVLLVEDDAVCRNLTTKFLQIFGCTIDVASDGVEAVNKMQSGVYDIVSLALTSDANGG